ncbi:hypothetical protein Q5O24_02615 [Eubacteriaceae bacterium ES3]|nr:hypothetical protein Q5O24_02615 [Eubacteriaceae bacterium ES3]
MKYSKNIIIIFIGLVLVVFIAFLSTDNRINNQEETMIGSMDEIELLDSNENLERQVVIIYNEGVKADIGLLNLDSSEVIKGRNLSEHVDVIEVDESINLDEFIRRLNENEVVMIADYNGVIRTTNE